jgi:hypothetical protein
MMGFDQFHSSVPHSNLYRLVDGLDDTIQAWQDIDRLYRTRRILQDQIHDLSNVVITDLLSS